MKSVFGFLLTFLFVNVYSYCQSIGIGTSTPNTTAALDITSTTKGVLIPRLTTAQRDAISSPANGLMIYNSTTKQYNFYNGTGWQQVNGIPKGAMVIGETHQDSTILKEGFIQNGFLTQDFITQVFGDTTIAAFNWYLGNRADYQNQTAPGLDGSIAGFNGTDLFVFTNDTIYIYNQQADKWSNRPVNSASATGGLLLDIIQNGTIVWTGSEFLLWGGGNRVTASFPCGIGNICYHYSPLINNGLRYKPATNTWEAISLINAPEPRFNHEAIWTGTEMVVWGGRKEVTDSSQYYLNTGARYNPVTNTWTALPVAEGFEPREKFVMTMAGGNNFIIWGGRSTENKTRSIANPCSPFNQISFPFDSAKNYSNGRIYNLSNNTWTAMSIANAPMGRFNTTGQWDFNTLVIAGGKNTITSGIYCGTCFTNNIIPTPYPCAKVNLTDSVLKTGARYDMNSNTWTTIPNSPKAFAECDAFWDNEQYISYFGQDSIISYEPSAGDWFQTLFPPLLPFSNTLQREVVWTTGTAGGLNNLVVLPPWIPNFNRQAVYNLRFTPTTLTDLKSTATEAGKRLYLYRKE